VYRCVDTISHSEHIGPGRRHGRWFGVVDWTGSSSAFSFAVLSISAGGENQWILQRYVSCFTDRSPYAIFLDRPFVDSAVGSRRRAQVINR